ncbi:MAG: MBL fold metallo-hydrolase, partial [Planctomycetota bacterium]
FLGTTGYRPTEKRHTSCLLLPEIGVAFDAGTGMFRLGERLQADELRLFLSHAHLDHVVGLTYLLPELRLGKIGSATVYGEAEKLAAIREHLFSEAIFPAEVPYLWEPLCEPIGIPGGTVRFRRQERHPGGSVAFRIDFEDGKSVAYCTDTTADPSDVEAITFVRGVDLLIHECNFADEHSDWSAKTGHSNVTPVAEVAREAGVGGLVLTHFDPYAYETERPIDVDVARSIFPETTLAEDLGEVDL